MRRILYALPVLAFLVIAWFLYDGLYLSPRDIPSALIGKPVPEFNLGPVPGRPGPHGDKGLATADLKTGQPQIVNIFASWCGPCRVEHPLLMALAERNVAPIHGIDYKDRPEAALRFLDQLGDPYQRIGADVNGRAGIELGVYGVPETFVISGDGQILCKHVGPLSAQSIEEKIVPALAGKAC
ncbi:DsbE family thiol:disulfide interchange protein [Zavarzinia sp. CC-PAN008]|uniref:DsbE family thiol:disulfide interchange protein n=1 Tax=Zavarzinia sp. CC-PAN008 TaxID=3243332 RepID=UPI003F74528F